MPEVRFPHTLRVAGEDYWVLWALLARASTTMYCLEATVTYGTGGVGTYQHTSFDSITGLLRDADEVRWRRHVLDNYPLTPRERRLLHERLGEHREAALLSALNLLRRRQEDTLKEIIYLLRDDPACAASWCLALPKLLYARLRRGSVTTARQPVDTDPQRAARAPPHQ